MKAKDLKFRRWIEERNQYAYFTAKDMYFAQQHHFPPELLKEWEQFFLDWDEMIIEQWTGLVDKNGKEIYEGDYVGYIVKGMENDLKKEGVVTFNFSAFGITENLGDELCEYFMSFEQRNDEWSDYYGDLLIIGNIHEKGDVDV